MFKFYYKQAVEMLKQNKLFSALYITGTGLAIAMTMVVFVAHYLKVAPIYPEENRNRIWILKHINAKIPPHGNSSYYSSYKTVKEWWYPLQHAEAISAVYQVWDMQDYYQPSDGMPEEKVIAKYTDPAFFRVYDYHFVDGRPFSQEEFDSGMMSAVIAEGVAIRLFGTAEGIVGKTISLNYSDCRIVGVVNDGSAIMGDSFGEFFLPYTVYPGYDKTVSRAADAIGAFQTFFLVKDDEQGKALEAEVAEIVRKYNSSQEKVILELYGPEPQWINAYRVGIIPLDWGDLVFQWGGLFIIFLLVPALNLSGMISSRMENRLPEMGISKAFGASRSRLLRQVLAENLVLTCMGGLFGLLVAVLVLIVGKDWLFIIFDRFNMNLMEGIGINLSWDMLISPWLFIAAFIVCLLLNLLSATLPAWRALRKEIVYSLNQKK